MQSTRTRTKHDFPISIACCEKTPRSLDPPTETGGLAFRLHHPAVHILPLRLRAVKGRKLFPLTVLVSAAHGVQRDGSDGSKLHFLHKQGPEEANEAYYEFESAW